MEVNAQLVQEENRRIRLLRISADLLVRTLMSGPVTLSEADKMIQGVRMLALELFPGKGEAFDLIYMPRFRRALREAGILKERKLGMVRGRFVGSDQEGMSQDTAN